MASEKLRQGVNGQKSLRKQWPKLIRTAYSTQLENEKDPILFFPNNFLSECTKHPLMGPSKGPLKVALYVYIYIYIYICVIYLFMSLSLSLYIYIYIFIYIYIYISYIDFWAFPISVNSQSYESRRGSLPQGKSDFLKSRIEEGVLALAKT